MSKFKIPYNWTEAECREAIKKLLTESAIRYSKNHYDDSAKMLIAAAQVMVKIPTIKRKEQHRISTNEKIKKRREPKPEESPRTSPVDQLPDNPFKDK